MTHKKRCAIYTRSASDTADCRGIAKQQLICRGFIAMHDDWTLVEKEYNDCCVSGLKLYKPALYRLLEDSEDEKIDIVVMKNISRLDRGGSFDYIQKFQQLGAEVIFVEDHYLEEARISTHRASAPAS